jgi:hypothetical protein
LEGTYCNAAIFIIDMSTSTLAKRDHPVLVGSPSAGPGAVRNADKRTRSKWSRVMRYAVAYKPDSEPLDQFVRPKGGINACAAMSAPRRRRGIFDWRGKN